jgi:hypothetical protein
MTKILIPTKSVGDWKQLLADPNKHWKAGFSAMATALSWEAAQGLPQEIRDILGCDSELLFAFPEHKVPLPGGSRESQCDVFALVRSKDQTLAVAVEAKVNEHFGPTIAEWSQSASDGKIRRLQFICSKLGVAYPPPPALRYQLFHRTVAAIVEAERFKADNAAMVIQSFSQEHRWFEEFAEFCELLGVPAARGRSLDVTLPDQRSLFLGWATGSPEFLMSV